MLDHEIKTKRLTDWKPETDIKLQKAFGKFVEEAGELLESITNARLIKETEESSKPRLSLEDELADVAAFVEVIVVVCEDRIAHLHEHTVYKAGPWCASYVLSGTLVHAIGKSLAIIGRCQIQGLDGTDPETKIPNAEQLRITLSLINYAIARTIDTYSLNAERIKKRKEAKIESKLPWVMGTATDLLPDE